MEFPYYELIYLAHSKPKLGILSHDKSSSHDRQEQAKDAHCCN